MNAFLADAVDQAIEPEGAPLSICSGANAAAKVVKQFSPEVANAILWHTAFLENAEIQALKTKGLITEEQMQKGVVCFAPKASERREGVIPPWETRRTPGIPSETYLSDFKQVGDEVGRLYPGFPIMTEGKGLILPKAAFDDARQSLAKPSTLAR